MRFFTYFLGLVGLVLRPVVAEEAPCTAHNGDDYYDLSSLSAKCVSCSVSLPLSKLLAPSHLAPHGSEAKLTNGSRTVKTMNSNHRLVSRSS